MASKQDLVKSYLQSHHLVFGISDVHLMLWVRWLRQLGYI